MSDLRKIVDTDVPLKAEVWEGTYIRFDFISFSKSGKTQCWSVFPKDDQTDYLGAIEWMATWRKYAFFPNPETVYEETCMNDISTFIKMLTKKHRESK